MERTELLEKALGKENVLLNEPMSRHTSFKTGGNADVFVKVKNIEGLKEVLKFAKDYDMPIFVLGNGSNILVTDKGIRGIVCKIEINKFDVEETTENIFVTVGSRK